jgi:predicted Fe-S protein YdhL (DUF1289 family)
MYGYIYKIECLINKKCYIGQTKMNKDGGIKENYWGSGVLIKKAISKYGIGAFSRSIIEFCENADDLNKKEIFFIKEFSSIIPNGYNIGKGGENADHLENWMKENGHPTKLSKESFIQEAKKVHKNKFDYSKIEYINTNTKVNVTCPTHGEFSILPSNHLYHSLGCPMCIKEEKKNKNKLNFIKKSLDLYPLFPYNYENIDYFDSKTPIKIMCELHGEFSVIPDKFLYRNAFCPSCKKDIIERITQEKRLKHERTKIISLLKRRMKILKKENIPPRIKQEKQTKLFIIKKTETEVKKIISEKSKLFWKNMTEEERKAIGEKISKSWTEEKKLKKSKQMVEKYKDEKERKKDSESVKAVYIDPIRGKEIRKKISESVKITVGEASKKRRATYEKNKEYYSVICRYGALITTTKQKIKKGVLTEEEGDRALLSLQNELEHYKEEFNGKN